MGKTYRRMDKKQKKTLKNKRIKRTNARRIQEDSPRRETGKNRQFSDDGMDY